MQQNIQNAMHAAWMEMYVSDNSRNLDVHQYLTKKN